MPRERIDVDELLRRKSEAEAVASEANAALERHDAQLAEERERREQQFEAGVVAEFFTRDAALLAEEKAARDAFAALLVESPAMSAWIDQRAARWARVALSSEVQNASNRLGRDRNYHPLEARDPRLLEDVVSLAEDEAKRRGFERIDVEIVQPRARHIAGEEDPA